ncbi:MAG: DNA polymerase III subunit delta [Thermaerobacter sp.]|nr:DNA polymerase III subunit delta [Thermaerobacter sp.]
MNHRELSAALQQGDYRCVYLLAGPEDYLRWRAREALKQALVGQELYSLNYVRLAGDDPEACSRALEELRVVSFGNGRRLVAVDLEAGGEKAQATWERVLRDVAAGPPEGGTLVLSCPDAAPGGKLARLAGETGAVVDCRLPAAQERERWAVQLARSRGKKLTPQAAALLVEGAGDSLGTLVQEVEKVCLWADDQERVDLPAVAAVARGAAVAGTVFQLVDHLGERRAGQALGCLQTLLRQGEVPLVILSLLARQLRLLLGTCWWRQAGGAEERLAGYLGVPSFVARKLWRQAANFREEELVEGLRRLLEANGRIKTGWRPELVLTTALVHLAGPRQGRAGRVPS